jgi:hypothetical protein
MAAGTHRDDLFKLPLATHRKRIDPTLFTKILSGVGISLGATLLLPVVPTAVATLGLAAFSSGLLGLYLRTPGMRQPGSLRPPRTASVWLRPCGCLGIAAGLLLDALTSD